MAAQGKRSQALTEEETERVRVVLRALLQAHGTQAILAERCGVSQQAISLVLSGGRIGIHNARKIASFAGVALDELLAGEAERPEPRLRALPGWDEAVAEARRRFPRADKVYDQIGDLRWGGRIGALTPEWIADLAHVWSKALSVVDGNGNHRKP